MSFAAAHSAPSFAFAEPSEHAYFRVVPLRSRGSTEQPALYPIDPPGAAWDRVSNSDSTLRPLWSRAGDSAVPWSRVPDAALDHLARSGAEASDEDLTFLAQMVSRGREEAVAAARLLACIAEDGLAPREPVVDLLGDFLEHGDPAVRIAAVLGFEQLAERPARARLQRLLAGEGHPEARRTLEYVIHVLG